VRKTKRERGREKQAYKQPDNRQRQKKIDRGRENLRQRDSEKERH
jgi:hypothetical protein